MVVTLTVVSGIYLIQVHVNVLSQIDIFNVDLLILLSVQKKEGLYYPWIPIALAGVFAFLVAHCFISIYEVTFCNNIYLYVQRSFKSFPKEDCTIVRKRAKFLLVTDDHRYNIHLFLRGLREERRDQQTVLHEPWINGDQRFLDPFVPLEQVSNSVLVSGIRREQ